MIGELQLLSYFFHSKPSYCVCMFVCEYTCMYVCVCVYMITYRRKLNSINLATVNVNGLYKKLENFKSTVNCSTKRIILGDRGLYSRLHSLGLSKCLEWVNEWMSVTNSLWKSSGQCHSSQGSRRTISILKIPESSIAKTHICFCSTAFPNPIWPCNPYSP